MEVTAQGWPGNRDIIHRGKTKAVYLPLVDMVPPDPTTMLTVMTEAQKLTNAAGQQYTIFTNDQQLYKVSINVE